MGPWGSNPDLRIKSAALPTELRPSPRRHLRPDATMWGSCPAPADSPHHAVPGITWVTNVHRRVLRQAVVNGIAHFDYPPYRRREQPGSGTTDSESYFACGPSRTLFYGPLSLRSSWTSWTCHGGGSASPSTTSFSCHDHRFGADGRADATMWRQRKAHWYRATIRHGVPDRFAMGVARHRAGVPFGMNWSGTRGWSATSSAGRWPWRA